MTIISSPGRKGKTANRRCLSSFYSPQKGVSAPPADIYKTVQKIKAKGKCAQRRKGVRGFEINKSQIYLEMCTRGSALNTPILNNKSSL